MELWQKWLLCALGALALGLFLWSRIAKVRRRRERDFTRRLETVLLPREEIDLICPGREGRWVKTNQRLLLEQGEGFFALPLSKLQKLQGQDREGKATAAPEKMVCFTLNGEYTLQKKSPAFVELTKALKAAIRRNNALKKERQKKQEEKKKP